MGKKDRSAEAKGLTTQCDKKKKWKPETTQKTGRNPKSLMSRKQINLFL